MHISHRERCSFAAVHSQTSINNLFEKNLKNDKKKNPENAAYSKQPVKKNHRWQTVFGTHLKKSGMTSAQIADMLGHADTRMVDTVYARARHEGIMKNKNTVEMLNQAYARGTSVAPETPVSVR